MVVLEVHIVTVVVAVPFRTEVAAVVGALAEDAVVDDLQTSNVKFFLNLGTMLMFVILGLM